MSPSETFVLYLWEKVASFATPQRTVLQWSVCLAKEEIRHALARNSSYEMGVVAHKKYVYCEEISIATWTYGHNCSWRQWLHKAGRLNEQHLPGECRNLAQESLSCAKWTSFCPTAEALKCYWSIWKRMTISKIRRHESFFPTRTEAKGFFWPTLVFLK